MNFESILNEVGSFGRFQKMLLFLFLVPVELVLPWFTMSTFFLLSTPDHWCNVPQLANLTKTKQLELVSPTVIKQGLTSPDSCQMYDLDYSSMVNATFNIEQFHSFNVTMKLCQEGWTYDKTYYDATAVTEV